MSRYTIEDFVTKRKRKWEEWHDIELDEELVSSIAREILSSSKLVAEVRAKPHLLIECCFSLVDKNKRNVPFFLNDVQRDFIEQIETHGTKKPYFILKGRQQGFTTIVTAIVLANAIVNP